MDINSKEFYNKFKRLFDKGYCKECISFMTSPLTIGDLCRNCKKIFLGERK